MRLVTYEGPRVYGSDAAYDASLAIGLSSIHRFVYCKDPVPHFPVGGSSGSGGSGGRFRHQTGEVYVQCNAPSIWYYCTGQEDPNGMNQVRVAVAVAMAVTVAEAVTVTAVAPCSDSTAASAQLLYCLLRPNQPINQSANMPCLAHCCSLCSDLYSSNHSLPFHTQHIPQWSATDQNNKDHLLGTIFPWLSSPDMFATPTPTPSPPLARPSPAPTQPIPTRSPTTAAPSVDLCSLRGGHFSWRFDGMCDAINNNKECAWDGGDCCVATCSSAKYDCGKYPFDCKSPTDTNTPTKKPSRSPSRSPSPAPTNTAGPPSTKRRREKCSSPPSPRPTPKPSASGPPTGVTTIDHRNYQNDEDVYWAVNGTGDGSYMNYVFTFSQPFATEPNYDYVAVGVMGTPVSAWISTNRCSGMSCEKMTVVSNRGIQVYFHSDYALTAGGFTVTVTIKPTAGPSRRPTLKPSPVPTTASPSASPTLAPVFVPTMMPVVSYRYGYVQYTFYKKSANCTGVLQYIRYPYKIGQCVSAGSIGRKYVVAGTALLVDTFSSPDCQPATLQSRIQTATTLDQCVTSQDQSAEGAGSERYRLYDAPLPGCAGCYVTNKLEGCETSAPKFSVTTGYVLTDSYAGTSCQGLRTPTGTFRLGVCDDVEGDQTAMKSVKNTSDAAIGTAPLVVYTDWFDSTFCDSSRFLYTSVETFGVAGGCTADGLASYIMRLSNFAYSPTAQPTTMSPTTAQPSTTSPTTAEPSTAQPTAWESIHIPPSLIPSLEPSLDPSLAPTPGVTVRITIKTPTLTLSASQVVLGVTNDTAEFRAVFITALNAAPQIKGAVVSITSVQPYYGGKSVAFLRRTGSGDAGGGGRGGRGDGGRSDGGRVSHRSLRMVVGVQILYTITTPTSSTPATTASTATTPDSILASLSGDAAMTAMSAVLLTSFPTASLLAPALSTAPLPADNPQPSLLPSTPPAVPPTSVAATTTATAPVSVTATITATAPVSGTPVLMDVVVGSVVGVLLAVAAAGCLYNRRRRLNRRGQPSSDSAVHAVPRGTSLMLLKPTMGQCPGDADKPTTAAAQNGIWDRQAIHPAMRVKPRLGSEYGEHESEGGGGGGGGDESSRRVFRIAWQSSSSTILVGDAASECTEVSSAGADADGRNRTATSASASASPQLQSQSQSYPQSPSQSQSHSQPQPQSQSHSHSRSRFWSYVDGTPE